MSTSEQVAKRKKSYRVVWIIGIVIVLAIAAHWGVNYLMFALTHETTDDAFVEGHVIGISPLVSGNVLRVFVNDNQQVSKGDMLVQIDPRDYQAKVDSAEASLIAAKAAAEQSKAQIDASKAEAKRTETELKRYQELLPTAGVSKQQFDNAVAAAQAAAAELEATVKQAGVAQARVGEANAAMETARLQLSYTKITAPTDGKVTKKSVEQGVFVSVGQPLLAIVEPNLWVVANYKETQLNDMRVGQKASIKVDAYPDMPLKGYVESIQAGTGARFSLLPPENATGNYVKVVQRVPVKIVFEEPNESKIRKLAPGMSVVPSVSIK